MTINTARQDIKGNGQKTIQYRYPVAAQKGFTAVVQPTPVAEDGASSGWCETLEKLKHSKAFLTDA